MFNATPARKLTNLLPSSATLVRLARLSGLLIRAPRSVFPDELFHAVLLSLTGNVVHLRGIAEKISSQLKHHPSRQAVFKRLRSERAAQFFYLTFKEVLNNQIKRFKSLDPRGGIDQFKGKFARILIEDSTVLPLHHSLIESFKGSSNQYGESSALRLRWVFDFLTGQTLDAQLHPWKDNDQSTAYELIDSIKKGDLILRDMGYFCLDCFHRMTKLGAYFITRIPEGTVISDTSENRIHLAGWLRKTPLNRVELDVKVGSTHPVAGRLVALRLDPKKTAERKKKLRSKSRDAKKVPTKDQLLMCGWVVVFTNVGEDKLDGESVAQLYRARWMVELFFKGMKSGQGLETWSRHRTNEYAIQCYAYAQMIIGILSLELWRWTGGLLAQKGQSALTDPKGPPSQKGEGKPEAIGVHKALEMFGEVLEKLFQGQFKIKSLANELQRRLKYLKQEKRCRKNLDELIFEVLS